MFGVGLLGLIRSGGQGNAPPIRENGLIGVIPASNDSGYEADALTSYATMYGSEPAIIHNVLTADSWADFLTYIDYYASVFPGYAGKVLWSFGGMLKTGTTLAAAAAGDYVSDYTDVFTHILAASPGTGPIYVRGPWEPNYAIGVWPWSYGNDPTSIAQYVTLFQLLVKAAWAVSPRFRFDYCPAVNPSDADPLYDPFAGWPGNEYVSGLGVDIYWMTDEGPLTGYSDPAAAWAQFETMKYGANDLYAFAQAHSVGLSFDETGANWNTFGFYAAMAAWAAGKKINWFSYLDTYVDSDFPDRISQQDYLSWDTGDDWTHAFSTAPPYGLRVNTNINPALADGTYFNGGALTNVGSLLTQHTGGNDYDSREYVGGAITAGAYELQIAYAAVSGNTTGFVGISFSGSAQNDYIYFDGTTVTLKSTNFGTPAFTTTENALMVTVPLTILSDATAYFPGLGPGVATDGAQINFLGLRLRKAS